MSKTYTAIRIMVLAYRKYAPIGKNYRIYQIMDWACSRYGIPYPEAHYLQIDILNGAIEAY